MQKPKELPYCGAIVLGMHDALVELSGIIAGLTFAVENNRIIVMTGAITAASASLSMAVANYQALRADDRNDAARAAVYTCAAYVVTSIMLILPFVVLENRFWALGAMGVIAVLIIFVFNSVTGYLTGRPFMRQFWVMLGICACVALAAFFIGQSARHFLGISI